MLVAVDQPGVDTQDDLKTTLVFLLEIISNEGIIHLLEMSPSHRQSFLRNYPRRFHAIGGTEPKGFLI